MKIRPMGEVLYTDGQT